MAREEARAKYVTKKKIKRLEGQLIVSIGRNQHTSKCGAMVGSAYLATSAAVQRLSQTFLLFLRGQVLEDMHAALPSRLLVLCQIRAPEDAAHAVDGVSAARLMMRTMTLASLMVVIADMVSRATTVQVMPRKLRKTRQLRGRQETSALLTTRRGTKKDRGKKLHF